MLFGLNEDEGEILSRLVKCGEKPKIEASRICLNKIKDGKQVADRSVKLTLTSSTIVQHIMTRAKHLRRSEPFGKVFISPDRSPEERAKQQQHVLERKKRSNDEQLHQRRHSV